MRVFLSLTLALAMLCGVTPPVVAAASTGTVTGVVVDQQNGLGISAASVALMQADASIATTKTDNGGKFEFDNVAPGLYTVLVRVSGFEVSRSREFVAVQGTETTVNLAVAR